MTRRARALMIAVLACWLALAAAAQAATRAAPPVITSVSPLNLSVGDTLTIKGRNFVAGKRRNVVLFQRVRARAVFALADYATTTRLTMQVPAKLLPFLTQRGGVPSATRFRLRVLSRRFGLAFTPTSMSPVIGPLGPGRSVPPPPTANPADCHPDLNSMTTDTDKDLIPDALEVKIHTNPCNPDTDGDGITDGYEYHSALDLNSRALPYPGKRPYPNPLDRTDANTDYDGDGLTQFEEYSAWSRYYPPVLVDGKLAAYSDGNQATQGLQPVPPGMEYLNTDSSCGVCSGSAGLTDDELDVDGDGIGNWDEIRGAFDPNQVKHLAYKPTLDWLDPDTDGDGLPDGQDDQDHDDIPNAVELIRNDTGFHVPHRFDSISSNPMDPCDPDPNSRSCPLHPEG
jgi:IPT/TIG domain